MLQKMHEANRLSAEKCQFGNYNTFGMTFVRLKESIQTLKIKPYARKRKYIHTHGKHLSDY